MNCFIMNILDEHSSEILSSSSPGTADAETADGVQPLAIRGVLLDKITQRCRLCFTYRYYEDCGGDLVLTAGDSNARAMFQSNFDGVSFDSLLGPASCSNTLMKIYSDLFHKKCCEEYLTLYGADGTWYASFVSFHLVPFANGKASSNADNVAFGVVSISKPNPLGDDINEFAI